MSQAVMPHGHFCHFSGTRTKTTFLELPERLPARMSYYCHPTAKPMGDPERNGGTITPVPPDAGYNLRTKRPQRNLHTAKLGATTTLKSLNNSLHSLRGNKLSTEDKKVANSYLYCVGKTESVDGLYIRTLGTASHLPLLPHPQISKLVTQDFLK